VTLLDVGANAEARREHLVQYAFMGAALVRIVLGVERPRVGLLSNGEEDARGNPLIVAAGAELRERSAGGLSAFEYVGNVEGDDLAGARADVVVCDGFTGNVALKLMEGVSQAIIGGVREAALSSTRAKLGGLLMRPALRSFGQRIDPEEHGGAFLLGLRRLGVVPHGRFSRAGFASAILRARLGAAQDIVGQTHAALAEAGALKRSPVSAPEASLRP
jgi:glycerol-3-phosphate acyltransferase PlsX